MNNTYINNGIKINNLRNYPPCYTDEGYAVAKENLKNMTTPQQCKGSMLIPSMYTSIYGNNIPTCIPCGGQSFGAKRGMGSNSPF
jgi:hypothetical protein